MTFGSPNLRKLECDNRQKKELEYLLSNVT